MPKLNSKITQSQLFDAIATIIQFDKVVDCAISIDSKSGNIQVKGVSKPVPFVKFSKKYLINLFKTPKELEIESIEKEMRKLADALAKLKDA